VAGPQQSQSFTKVKKVERQARAHRLRGQMIATMTLPKEDSYPTRSSLPQGIFAPLEMAHHDLADTRRTC
jgi:hypothetical protein